MYVCACRPEVLCMSKTSWLYENDVVKSVNVVLFHAMHQILTSVILGNHHSHCHKVTQRSLRYRKYVHDYLVISWYHKIVSWTMCCEPRQNLQVTR